MWSNWHESGKCSIRYYCIAKLTGNHSLWSFEYSRGGSGYKHAMKQTPGCQGGSSFVDPKYESKIEQNTEIPVRDSFTVPYIQIKLL